MERERARRLVRQFAGPVAIALAFEAMLLWSWGTWPDPIVDFGKELYIASALARGKRLYLDVAYFSGPLSPHFNAVCFALFGATLRTLVWVNVAIAALIVALLHRLLDEIAGSLAATVAALVFVLWFAFAEYVPNGNYNYVCPYVHEVTHGLLFALIALAALRRFVRSDGRSLVPIAIAGACVGLCALTRVEMLLAALVAVGGGLALAARSLRERRAPSTVWAVALAAAALPVAIALALTARSIGVRAAWHWIFFSIGVARRHAGWEFYRRGMGTLDVGASLAAMARWLCGWLAFLAPAAWLALRCRGPRFRRPVVAVAIGVATFALFVALDRFIDWVHALRPLPLALIAIGAHALLALRRSAPAERGPLTLRLAFTALALALTGKTLLFCRLYHFGFVATMPGTLLVVAALVSLIPRRIDAAGGTGRLFAAAALGVLCAATLDLVKFSAAFYRAKAVTVGSGANSFQTAGSGEALGLALAKLDEIAPPTATLAVLPEGAMLNFLSRRDNPTPFLNLVPTEWDLWRERVLPAFETKPPDFVALVHGDLSEYGRGDFGVGYAQELMAFIRERYGAVWMIGQPPFREGRFGILLLRRRSAP